MEAAKESFAQRHSVFTCLYKVGTALHLLEHCLSDRA